MTQTTALLGAMAGAALSLAILLPFCVAAEMLWPLKEYRLRDRAKGALWIVLAPGLMVVLTIPLHSFWQWLHVPILVDISSWPLATRVVVLTLLFDFLRYWEHRFEHRFWWPVHAVHHSPHELHAANAFSHPLIALPEFLLVVIPISFVETGGGGVPGAIWTVLAFQNFIIHSPLTLHAGRMRSIYVDSRYHRIHHSMEERHWNQNFGFLFSFWDRLFGTAYSVDGSEWPDTGVPGMLPPVTTRAFLMQPLRMWSRQLRELGPRAAVRAEQVGTQL